MRDMIRRAIGAAASRGVRYQPDYQDEVTEEHRAELRRIVDESKPADFKLTPISDPGW